MNKILIDKNTKTIEKDNVTSIEIDMPMVDDGSMLVTYKNKKNKESEIKYTLKDVQSISIWWQS